jgi:hypothetical protein
VDGGECAAAGRSRASGLSFVYGGQHFGDILVSLGGLRLGGNFEVQI